VLLASAASCTALAQSPPEVAPLLADVIRIVNQQRRPANEAKLAEFPPVRCATSASRSIHPHWPQPGKSHFIARLRAMAASAPSHRGPRRRWSGRTREWTVDPFAGLIRDGYVWGRRRHRFQGGLGIFAQAVLDIARQKRPLATQHHLPRQAMRRAARTARASSPRGLEQDRLRVRVKRRRLDHQGAAARSIRQHLHRPDKYGVSLVLTAHGTSTHSSMPQPDNAIFAWPAPSPKLSAYTTPNQAHRIDPSVLPDPRRYQHRADEDALPQPRHQHRSQADCRSGQAISRRRYIDAIMRNTIAPVPAERGLSRQT